MNILASRKRDSGVVDTCILDTCILDTETIFCLIIFYKNSTSVKTRTALQGVNRLYLGEISCILYTC